MNPSLLTLIINLVLVAFVLFGFLGGLKGIKKSTFNLVVFLINLVVVFFITPMVSGMVLKISIQGKTVNDHIMGFVAELIGEETAQTAFIQDIIASLPIMIANIVVSIVLILVVGLILKLISLIVYKLMFKKQSEKVVEKCEIVNGAPQMVKTTVKAKKHRLAGGFVGALHGFILALAIFMPLCGLVNVYTDVAGVATVSAEATSGLELKPIKDLLAENIPSEAQGYIKAVQDSILAKVGGIGNVAEHSLNLVASTNINGITINLGNEIKSLVKTYDTFVDFATSSLSDLSSYDIQTIYNDLIENPQNYDFEKLHNVVDVLFSSNLINSLGKDGLKFAVDLLVDSAADEQAAKMFNHIKTAVYNYAESSHTLKEEVTAVVNVFEICVKSGLIEVFTNEKILVEDITNIVLNDADPVNNKTENEVLNNICTNLTDSYLLQKLALEFANYGLSELEIVMNDNLEFSDNNNITLIKIDSELDYTIRAAELANLLEDGLKLYDIIEGLDTKAIEEDVYNIFDTDLEGVATAVGKVLNSVVSMSMLKDTGVFNSLCDAMAKTEYNNFVDFNLLKSESTITTQFNYLSQAIGEIKESGIINTIRYIDDQNINESVNEIVDKLAVTNEGKTYIARILTPVLKCSLFKNALIYGLEEAHNYIETQLQTINPNKEIADFNTSNIMTEDENTHLINVLNNLVSFVAEIDVAKLSNEEFVETIIYSDLNKVGRAFESIRTSTLFKDYDGHQGVYNDIMDLLAGSEYAEYFNFEVAKDTNFTWTNATDKLITLRDELDTITITTQDGDVKLLKYILTSGNYDDLLDSLSGKTVNLKGIFELELISPIAVKVVNLVNAKIKEFVGEELGANIEDIDILVSLTNQAESINNVINSALALDLENLDLNNMSDDDKTKLNSLLDTLEVNAKATEYEGVFKHSYNAMLLKTINLINEAIKEITGDAGKNIVTISAPMDVLAHSQQIKALLNTVIDLSESLENLDLSVEGIDQKIISLINAFKTVSEVSEDLFKPTFNALLVYSINQINSAVADAVGSTYSTEIITTYTGDEDVTLLYNYIIEVIESGNEVFNILDGRELKDIVETSETALTRFKNALNSNDFTRCAYNAVKAYLENELI